MPEQAVSRRRFVALTAGTAAGAALVRSGTAFAASSSAPAGASLPAPGVVQRTWSSESTASGYGPGSTTWYSDPATGLSATAFKLSRQSDLALAPAGSANGQVITVEPTIVYQSLLGIGASMEDSTINNLALMSGAARTKALKALFDPSQNAGFSLARICFGASDFSAPPFYTYDDGKPDPQLKNFSIQQDIERNIISTLKEALQINPNLLVFGTAWSAPAWMKDNNSLYGGGALLDKYIPTLATYYRKIVQAYAEHGIHIHAVTPQNEPEWSATTYPTMQVYAPQEQKLIEAMRKEFDTHHLTTQIWAFDYNFDYAAAYVPVVFGTAGNGYTDAYHDTTAIAFHDYSGGPGTMSQMKNLYRNHDMIMTERMWWGTNGADRIVQYLQNWSVGYVSWVTMLDQNMATSQFAGTPNSTPFIQDPTSRDTYWALPEYYIFSQFSKYIQRGAKRIYSDYGSSGTVTTVSFLNPDGTIATVVVNQNSTNQSFTLRSQEHQITDTLPAKTVGTYVWQPTGSTKPGIDAYATTKASACTYFANCGAEVTGDSDGGMDVGWISWATWFEFQNVEFGSQGATQFQARFASAVGSSVTGEIQVRLDSPTAEPVGSIPVASTGGWQNWVTKTAGVSRITGNHTVYLTFASNQLNNFVNVNWFTFK
jgi:O-glycosyl hydrolase